MIEECADLNFTHLLAHGGQVKEAAFEGSHELLGELESVFPKVFDEPQYPITANHTLFTIELVDPALPPKHGQDLIWVRPGMLIHMETENLPMYT